MNTRDPDGNSHIHNEEQAEAHKVALARADKIIAMPEPELERTAKVKKCGDRRAIEVLFETKLDGDRVNLLLARIYVACENAERDVMALGDHDVERVLKRFKEGPAGANGS